MSTVNPVSEQIEFSLKGTFTNSGFLAGSFFEGYYLYDPDTPDTNPNVVNVGVFEVPNFEIRIFDSQSNLVDTLNEQNSNASVILSDFSSSIPGADQYQFSTTQDTETISNAFFEHGSIDLTFDWSSGGSTTSAPVLAPGTFEEGYFSSYAATNSWDGFINPQSVQDAEILAVHEPPSNNLILYRINVGGGLVTSADASIPNWSEDTDTNPSPFRIGSGGASIYMTSDTIDLSDLSLPASTSEAIFQSERWDPSLGENMQWEFPVDSGSDVEVRLYFAEIYKPIVAPDQRVFDVSVEGVIPTVFDNIDQYETAGQFSGFMLSHTVKVNDSLLSLEFLGNSQNPALKGIEILSSQVLDEVAATITTPDPVTGLNVGLYDADSDTLITSLSDGQQISASEVEGKSLTIAALVPEESIYFGQVESMFLNLNNGQVTQTENLEPYVLFGDNSGNFNGGIVPLGDNTITFELYSQDQLGGSLLDTVTVDFSIT
jgi:hypothetical protein